jgi:hypothetical protein
MDPYIIENMPDDETDALSHLRWSAFSVDGTQMFLDVAETKTGFELLASTNAGDGPAAVVAAFDPTLTLAQVMSVIMVMLSGVLIGASDEANATANRLNGTVEDDSTEDAPE